MTITALTSTTTGMTTTVTATGTLTGVVFYHWYSDGAHIARTSAPSWTFATPVNEQIRIDVIETNSDSFDFIANAPDGFPARKRLQWGRSDDDSVAYYRVDQKVAAGSFVQIANVTHIESQWIYEFTTPRLADLTGHTWKITPVDTNGDDGIARTVGPETTVRRPDAPNFTATFDDGTDKVTIAAA